MEIKPVRKIQDFRIRAYAPDGTYIGLIRDELQLMDFQLQVKEAEAEGYYITYKHCRYNVEKNGKIYDFATFFDGNKNTIHTMLRELVGF